MQWRDCAGFWQGCRGKPYLIFWIAFKDSRPGQQLRRVGESVKQLNQICDELRRQISLSRQQVGPAIDETRGLLAEKKQVESKEHLLRAFTSRFVISDTEVTALTSMSGDVDDHFFAVLTKVKKTHRDCELLLGSEEQRLGLEILEQSSKHLNAAFQKLYRWVQRQLRTLDLENPQIGTAMRHALRVLAERPALIQSILDSFAETRERDLLDGFHTALTGKSWSRRRTPSANPIEMSGHDPLRYIGDMLAWAHSATVSEREALEALFISEGEEGGKGIQSGLESDPWSRPERQSESFDGKKSLDQLVDRDLAGVVRLLKQRTEQTVASQEEPVVAYKIHNLISFYKGMFAKLLGPQSHFVDALHSIEESALRQFNVLMKDRVASLRAEADAAPENLLPPEFLAEVLSEIKELARSYDSAFAGTAVSNGDRSFQPILSQGLDPFLDMCKKLAKRLMQPDNDIFAINCLLAARHALKDYTFAKEKIEDLNNTINEHASALTEYQHRFFLESSGLYRLTAALASLHPETLKEPAIVPTLDAFKPSNLVQTSQQIDDFLPSALMDAMENVKRLMDADLARRITEDAVDMFCVDFAYVEDKIEAADEAVAIDERLNEGTRGDEDEDEDRTSLRECFPRTGAEIRVLLS